MAFVIYGHQDTPIGLDQFLVKCPSCETHNWADVMVVSHYFHLYFLPLFPTDKTADITCHTCGLRRYKMSFDQDLLDNYPVIDREYRHPWFTYAGIGLLVCFVLFFIVSMIFRT